MNRDKIEQVIVEVLKDKFGDGSAKKAVMKLLGNIPEEVLFDAVVRASTEPIYEEIDNVLHHKKIYKIVSKKISNLVRILNTD